MQAALITGRETLELIEFPDPRAAEGGVVVDVSFCGICGTDVHAYQSGSPYNPAICGHEWVGHVSECGDGVRGLDVGDRVVVGIAPICGRCAACRAGQSDHCQVAFVSALGRDPLAPPHGGFAERIAVSKDRVVRADPRLSDEQAAQVEPATVAFHAVRRSLLRSGDVAVVQGAGPIGLGTMQWVRAAGAGVVVVVEPNERRRDLALELGAHHAVAPGEGADQLIKTLTDGLGADIVYECVGRSFAVQSAVDFARRGGALCLVGLPDEKAPIDVGSWLVKEISATSALAYTRDEFAMAMSMIADGRFRTEPMHTATVGLDGLDSALADLASGQSLETKVLVDPRL
ncbi:MAG: zinc-binding dehydrogenase [Actinomycetota bacterium]|jgi:(R,R)-butanediol dehydrogenase/meso-butanediol dehydrogenase/diacetyl reductase|nr:zinc-binding dehydrogenase [Actinomycetota bacterium]MDA3011505.1 zinc-binding dehydrogenase [Actinomycetota bacterium]MDA3024157.1 zinc-binding dehydrogenase [Actinomycetota bacterium]